MATPLGVSTNRLRTPPPSSDPDPPSSSPTSEIALLKAANARLQTMLQVAAQKTQRKKAKKRKRGANTDANASDEENTRTTNRPRTDSDSPTSGPNFHSYGRDITHLQGNHLDILPILLHGIDVETDLDYDEENERLVVSSLHCPSDTRFSPETRIITNDWNWLCARFLGLKHAVVSVSRDYDAVEEIATLISSGMDAARATDSNTARKHIMAIIRQSEVPKVLRGFHNEHTAALLLPPALQHHAKEPDLHQKVVDKTINIHGQQLPAFLFPPGQYTLAGLLMSDILIWMAKAMYTGPASIFEGNGWVATKPGNAAISRLKGFTPRIVAYIACQVRFALSSQHAYNKIDGTFDYEVFFWFIVKAFAREETGERVLPRFNLAVLGRAEGLNNQPAANESTDDNAPAGPDALDMLWAATDLVAMGAA
ncbi:hypothetical protein GGX14DRAFT_565339 [Mycena pura]|uniref:Uncharacterized protein n=1 Tax=Mycena pura TaxID=153505 RepID=A0AAD6VES3_9AGAR|nr:hypothetical protein GGX14DRAFT_565339 [Mycena pura]